MLYELASGKHPFHSGAIFETLRALNEAAPRPPSSWNAFVPAQLDALILRMLAKDQTERPASAEVARTLESRFPSQTVEHPLVDYANSISVLATRPVRRWWIGIAALTVLAVAGGAIWWADVFVIRAEGSGLRRLKDQQHEDERANRPGMWQPVWSADGKWIYFSSDRSGRFEIWRMPSSAGPSK